MTPKSVITNRAAQTDRIFKDIVGKEKAAQDAKTARLKALRMAQSAEDAAAIAAMPKPAAKPKKAPVKRAAPKTAKTAAAAAAK